MPKLPMYDSQRSLTTRPTAPMTEAAGVDFSPLAKAASDMNQRWGQALDTIQYTSAKASFETGMQDVLNRAAQDPDYNGSDKYFEEVEKVRKNSMQGFKNKELEQKVGFDFDASASQYKLKIDNIFRKKQVEYSLGQLSVGIDALEQKRLSASPAEAQSIDAEIEELINANVAAGIITSEQGIKKVKDARVNAIDLAIAQNPHQALADLKDPKGPYKDAPAPDKVRKIAFAESKIKQLSNEAREERHTAALDLVLTGQINEEFINAEAEVPHDEGGLKASTIRDLRRAYNRQQKEQLKFVVEDSETAEKFNDLIEKVIAEPTTKQDLKDLLISSYADKVLNQAEAQKLNEMTKIMEQMKQNNDIRSEDIPRAYRMITSWFHKNPSDEDLSKSLKQLLGAVAKGDDPGISSQKIISNAVANKLKIDWAEIPKEGKEFMDSANNKIRVMPDGTYAEI